MKNKNNTREYTFIFGIILFVIILILIWYVFDVLLLTFAGILLAILLGTLNRTMNRFHLPNSISLTLLLLCLTLLIVGISIFIAPILNEQITNLIAEIPEAWIKLKQFLTSSFNIKNSTINENLQWDQFFLKRENLGRVANLFSNTFGFFGSLLVIFFIGIFLAYEPKTYINGFLHLIPTPLIPKTIKILSELTETLRWWLIGKFLSMAIVGVSTAFGLWVLNIPLAFTLGLFAALLTFIPNIGPILSAIPAVLLAMIISPLTALYVIILYLIIQIVESYIITPMVQNKTISLSPVLIIIFQLIMALLSGILGLALATPLLAVITVLVQRLYIENKDVIFQDNDQISAS